MRNFLSINSPHNTEILAAGFVFGLYDVVLLPATDITKHGLSDYFVMIGDSHVQAEHWLLFEMVCRYTVKKHVFIYKSYIKSNSAHVCHGEFIFLQGLPLFG
jgi:hypothetical protein